MLKLLLDVAEWALAGGHEQTAERALNAAARILDMRERMHHVWRKRVDPELLGQVIMYRLLYLRPRLLAWALEQIPRWEVDYRTLVRFVDDCVYERPDLIGAIRDARIAQPKPAANFREYLAHLDFLDTLLTPAAREYGMYLYVWLKRYEGSDDEPELLSAILPRLAAMLAQPELRHHAGWQLSQFLRHSSQAARDFMKEHGARMPVNVWWYYRKGEPAAPIPEQFLYTLPYDPPLPTESALARELEQFTTQHEREYEFRAQEERRLESEKASRDALQLGNEKAKAARQAAEQWHPDERAADYYQQALVQMRKEGSAGKINQASDFLYRFKHQLDMHYLEYDATGDPRYKDYIARHEAALEMIFEYERMKLAREQATNFAKKNWLGRLLHKRPSQEAEG
jgi:hypothetical protein